MNPIKFVDPQTQYDRCRDAIDQGMQAVIASGAFILGPQVTELEQQLAAFAGTKHCVGTASGTDSLLISLFAAGVGAGDEVITTPFTWFSTAEVISRSGATPVFVDIEPDSFIISAEAVESAITERTKALMPVSLYGQMPDLEGMARLAEKHGLVLIEDGAQSFGSTRNGVRSSGFAGSIGCTSFYPTKPFGCYGDGGAIFTNDATIAEKARHLRVHGQEGPQNHTCLGMNSRLDTIQAAIMLAKLPVFPSEIESRQQLAATYNEGLADILDVPQVLPGNTHVYGVYTLKARPEQSRDAIVAAIRATGLACGVYYPKPVHYQPLYAHLNLGSGSFPHAEYAAENVFSLPMHPYMEADQAAHIVSVVRDCVAGLS